MIHFKELEKFGFGAYQTEIIDGDMKDSINLNKVIKKLNINDKFLVKGIQTHSINILKINAGVNIENLQNIDGYISNDSKFSFCLYFADCMPLFLIDKKNKVFSLLHAGRVGTVNGILKNAIDIFKNDYKSKLEDIILLMGASISCKNYEISKDMALELKKKFKNDKILNIINDKYYLSIKEINYQIAIENGLLEENIYTNNYCTYEDNFYSYRRDKTSKRMVAILKSGE